MASRELYEELLRASPGNATYRHELALTYKNICKYIVTSGRALEALESTRRANDLEAALVRDFPDVADYRRELALTFNNLGVINMYLGPSEEQVDAFRKAIDAWTAHPAPNRAGRISAAAWP